MQLLEPILDSDSEVVSLAYLQLSNRSHDNHAEEMKGVMLASPTYVLQPQQPPLIPTSHAQRWPSWRHNEQTKALENLH